MIGSVKRVVGLALVGCLVAGTASADWISTDRFGYTGTITRYADAGLTEQVGDTINVGNRDLSIYVAGGYAIVMGSWWYTTHESGQSGWGNTTGNTGPGFMHYYDATSAFVQNQSFAFSDFNGTFWTTFTFGMSVTGADSAAYARLSAPANTGDGGIFHTLNLQLTATGLEGVESGGLIEAGNHPAGVVGTLSGVFQNTSITVPANNGFYAFDFTLSMDNWAWTNRDSLTGQYPFGDSSFAAQVQVPEPALLALFGLGLAGLAGRRRRER